MSNEWKLYVERIYCWSMLFEAIEYMLSFFFFYNKILTYSYVKLLESDFLKILLKKIQKIAIEFIRRKLYDCCKM